MMEIYKPNPELIRPSIRFRQVQDVSYPVPAPTSAMLESLLSITGTFGDTLVADGVLPEEVLEIESLTISALRAPKVPNNQ